MPQLEPKCLPFRQAIKTSLSLAVAGAFFFSIAALNAAEKWKLQYFYDKEESALAFSDLVCPSAKRCIAAGVLQEGKHEKGVIVATSDSGANWQLEEVKEHPISLFFLDDTRGWMVTDRGIWQTDEAGHGWKKIKDQKGLERVCFASEDHGYAVGAPKLVIETTDGGRKWSPLADAEKPATAADNTVYHWIVFPTKQQGLILGTWVLPRSPDEIPDWMSPERAKYRRDYPSTTILLQTTNGGKTWSQLTRSMEGMLTRFRFGSGDFGLALIEYPASADANSELFRMDLKTSHNTSIYRNPNRVVRDFGILPDGEAMIVATERVGKANALPIPGKLKIMRSTTMQTWIDMDVDYRAVAGRATFAAVDSKNVWVATDTGMILKLQ